MGWIITAVIVAAYLAVGAKRAPHYFHKYRENARTDWPTVHVPGKDERHNPEYATFAIMTALFWPYYEAYQYVSRQLISAATAEERKAKELAQARRIIAEYEAEQAARKPQ